MPYRTTFLFHPKERSLACALLYGRAARFDVRIRREAPCQKSMRQTVQVEWGMDYGERSPTSLLMYGRRKSEDDPHASQCCETTLILYAGDGVGAEASVPALSSASLMSILNQSPLARGLCNPLVYQWITTDGYWDGMAGGVDAATTISPLS